MLSENLQPITATVPTALAGAAALRPGQVFQTLVQDAANELFVRVAGLRVPLPEGAGLEAGQAVRVDVLDGLQLRITMPPEEPSVSAQPLLDLVSHVLESLGLRADANLAAQLVPPAAPQNTEAARALLTLFMRIEDLAGDLRQLAALAQQAVTAGALPEADAQPFLELAARLAISDPTTFQSALEQLAGGAGQAIEARIAMALASGNLDDLVEVLKTDARASLSRLRSNPGLVEFLRRTGQSRNFEQLAERVVERLLGGQLQNLRGLDLPYLFVELPCDPALGIRRAQVHLFHGGRGKGRRDEAALTAVLDVSMTRLGDLWVTVQAAAGRCVCRFEATCKATVEALSAASGELVAGLENAGYASARVEAALWNGDRLRATVALMRRFSGIDVKA